MVPINDLAAVGVALITHGVCSDWFFVRDLVLSARAGAWPAHLHCLLALWDMMPGAYGR